MMIHLISTLIGLYMALEGQHEVLECKVSSLESYGFMQMSEHDEYVCYNENDYTDFVVIEDSSGSVAIDDVLYVTLDESNSVIRYSIDDR